MINNLFGGTTVGVLEQVVNFSQERHGVLAGNIANLDTPGYKTRDLSPEHFQANLRKAIEAQRGERSPGHAGGGGIRDFDDVRESLKSILFHDGSDVSLERQISEISKNHGQHNLAINLMAAQFRLLEAAISERAV
ncbi:MAG: flagellar basal body protein [Planctomycetota bacterium]